MTTVAKGPEALRDLQGKHIGWTSWHEVDQNQVNLFADATGDHQWIHVDPRARSQGTFRRGDRPRVPDPVARTRADR